MHHRGGRSRTSVVKNSLVLVTSHLDLIFLCALGKFDCLEDQLKSIGIVDTQVLNSSISIS